MGRVLILSGGLWRLRGEIARLTGLEPVRAIGPLIPQGIEAIAGWGHKPTADAARRLAARREIPYLAIEDGFLRSVRAGPAEPPSSLVLDRTGIYYDARTASDLEGLIAAGGASTAASSTGRAIIEALKAHRLSKYNAAPPDAGAGLPPAGSARRVLVVDQTFADASIEGGLAGPGSFGAMLEAAIGENPGTEILVRLHPEVISGTKHGYLADLARRENLAVLARPINPWQLFEEVSHVYTVSSQLGLEALMAGCRVTCFGCPFYAGWGLTDDRQKVERRKTSVTLEALVAAAYQAYSHYFDAWTREPVDVFTAAEQLAFLAGHFHRHWRPVVGWQVSRWKRGAISRMLDGAGGPVSYERSPSRAVAMAKARGGAVAAWGRRADLIRPAAGAEGVPVITMEDGFLRSVGLGAGFVPAFSYIFDETGIYYDAARPSDIETLLNAGEFDARLLERADRLTAFIRSSGVTKYNLAPRVPLPEPPGGREVILVPGQVADDESIRRGAADLFAARPLASGGANLELLERVRARHPAAFIIYRPHPDVEAGFRHGRIGRREQSLLADHVDTGAPLNRLIERIDRVETATSLLGFEALLRGRPVTVHGCPFYAGWGLTEDLAPMPRRGRQRSLEQLTAAALICYPVYLDPVSGRVCPVEQVANRLLEAQDSPLPAGERLRRLLGAALGRARGVAQKAQLRINRLKS